MIRSIKKGLLMLTLMGVLAGCQHFPTPSVVIKPSAAEVQLQKLNEEHAKKNAELEKQIAELKANFQVKFDANLSLGVANVWASMDTLIADPNKDQFTLAALDGLGVAKNALPDPSIADYKKALETQRKLLSKQADEIAQGKAEIAAMSGEATKTKEELKQIADAKKKLEEDQKNEKAAFETERTNLSNEALKQTKEAAQLRAEQDAEKIKKAEDRKALEKWVVTILMVVGLIAGVISFVIKGPMQMFNPTAAIASAACIGLAIAVSFLPMWALILGLSTIFLIVVGAILYEVKRYRDIAKVGVGAIQEHKNENPEAFKNELAAKLKDWTGGKEKLEGEIEKLAKELNVKS